MSASNFDPYYEWLGISPHERPINHYRLLELPLFVSDTDTIRAAADAKMQHVRTFQSGKRASESQRLLNEISAARTCLLDSDTKATYDAVLQGQLASATATNRTAAIPQPPTPTGLVAPPPLAPPPTASSEPPKAPPVASASSSVPEDDVDGSPFYFQPWFPVFVVACVMLIGVGGWGMAILLRGDTETVEAPQSAEESEVDPTDGSSPPTDDPIFEGTILEPDLDGVFHLTADDATLEGNPQLAARADGNVILDIKSPEDRIHWQLHIEEPGPFRIEGTYATSPDSAGGEFVFQTGESESKLLSTRNTGDPAAYTTERIGFLWFKRSGEHRLTLVPKNIPAGQSLMTLRALRVVPVKGSGD